MHQTTGFGRYLRARRKAQDLTQSALAEQAGCAVDTVKKIEAGVLRPSRQMAMLLGEALQIPPSEQDAFVRLARVPLPPRDAVPVPAAAPGTPILPIPPTSLVGRTQALETLQALLLRADVRLLTLTGPPGIGKTRLALQVAADSAARFRHGVTFVNLAPLGDPTLVAPAIAQVLHVPEGEEPPLVERLRAFLRDKALLLVLDNFEQVLPAAPLLPDLLTAAPALRVLVTSRARLHVRGEQEWPVPELALPDPAAAAPADQLAAIAAVRLFVERARALQPDFALTAETAGTVAEICRRLDGLPLAIELAAARIKILPPAAMLRRLEHRLQLLTGGEQDLPARQRSLRAAIAWSYDLLTPPEQQLFRGLAVFQGGCTLESVEAVCAGADDGLAVLDHMDSLVDKNLLREEAGAGGDARFGLLETIHEYAREQLEASAELPRLQGRHAAFFLALAEQAAPGLQGPQQQAWLVRLEQEQANFRAVLSACLAADDTGAQVERLDLALRLVGALAWFWSRHNHMAEGRRWIEATLARAADLPGLRQGLAAARALYGAGVLAYSQGDGPGADPLLAESLRLARAAADRQVTADALMYLGVVRGYLGHEVGTGRALLEESIALQRATGDRWGLATAISYLGYLPLVEGDYPRARALFAEALPLFEALGDRWATAWVQLISGEAARCQGDYATAAELYTQSLAIHRALDDRQRIAIATNNLGYVALHQGALDQAAAYWRESMTLLDESGSQARMLSGLAGFAGLALARGRPVRAARLLGAVETLAAARRFHLEPTEQLAFDSTAAALQRTMDADALHAAREAGRALTWEQAMAEVREDPETRDGSPEPVGA